MALTASHSSLQVRRAIVLESLLVRGLASGQRLVTNEARLGLLAAIGNSALNEAILVYLLISRLVAAL